MIKIPTLTIVVRAIFHENNKCYPQVFLDECLYEIWKWKVKINGKEIDIKNLTYYYVDGLIRICDRDIDFSDILLDEKVI